MVLEYKWQLSQVNEVNRALQIVYYLKEQGLLNNIDFTFKLNPHIQTTEFNFVNPVTEMYISMITLKFL